MIMGKIDIGSTIASSGNETTVMRPNGIICTGVSRMYEAKGERRADMVFARIGITEVAFESNQTKISVRFMKK
jgi:hypothetical protein